LENKRGKHVLPGSRGGGVAQTMFAHVSTLKNDKRKKKKEKLSVGYTAGFSAMSKA
jgi:hypothetical protein